MRRPLFLRALLAVSSLALLATSVRADPVSWDYQTWAYPSYLVPDKAAQAPYYSNVWVSLQTAGGSIAGSSGLVLTELSAYSTFSLGDQGTFSHQPFQVALGIFDRESNRSQTVLFSAYLDGTYANGQASFALSYAPQSYSFQLGANLYQVDLGVPAGYPVSSGIIDASGPVHSAADASLDALVQVHHQPEPSTLVLLGVGGSLAGLLARRLRRKARRPAA